MPHIAVCGAMPEALAEPGESKLFSKHVWRAAKRHRRGTCGRVPSGGGLNIPHFFFRSRSGFFVGCRESLQSVWGELLKEKEISPCLTVRADW
jgi:hypothetical protein